MGGTSYVNVLILAAFSENRRGVYGYAHIFLNNLK